MLTEKEIITNLKKVLRDLFASTDFLKITDKRLEIERFFFSTKIKPDLIIEIQTIEKKRYVLIFEIKSAGQPRNARIAASTLREIVGDKKNWYGVFSASFISEESKQICRENGIGFIDMAGNCLFRFDNVYISTEGRPNLYPGTRPLKSTFSTKSSRALRVLLCNPGKEWFIKDLAVEANISLGQAFNIKERLKEFEFIEEIGSGKKLKFKLRNAESLLIKWGNNYSYQNNRINNFYSLESTGILEEKLIKYFKEKNIFYAFTLTSGSSKVAPFLRYARIFVYIKENADQIAEDLNLKKVTSGANITLLEPYDEGIFYGLQEIQGAKVVSDIQLYLDLNSYKERGEEAAKFLLEQQLRKRW